ncbi:MAG: hypothetical protein WCT03_01410 [Candidatus Obscuribacterales bacterium]|jgi:hypothetical protein
MSLSSMLYEKIVGQAFGAIKFQKTEELPVSATTTNRLRSVEQKPRHLSFVERLRHSFMSHDQSKTALDCPADDVLTDSSPVAANGSLVNFQITSKGKGLGIGSSVTVDAIAEARIKDSAQKRARVTSTRLTALESYLDNAAN